MVTDSPPLLLESVCGAAKERRAFLKRARELGPMLYTLFVEAPRLRTKRVQKASKRRMFAFGAVSADSKVVYLDMTVSAEEARQRGYPTEKIMALHRRDAFAAAETAMAQHRANRKQRPKVIMPWESGGNHAG